MPIQGESRGYNRPEGGWRFDFGGIKTNKPADELQPNKHPYAQNVRKVHSIQTRPGYAQLFTTVVAGAVLTAFVDGVQVLTTTVAGSNPLYIPTGLPGAIGVNNDAIDWAFDNWANGDGTTDLFTDSFTRANAATLGAGWIQSDIGALTTTFRVNGNRMKGPTKTVALNTVLELATPTTATAIGDQHCALQATTFGGLNTGPVRQVLRGNGTAVGTYLGYLLLFLTTGVNEPEEDHWIYSVQICHLNVATATLTVLATVTDLQILIGSTPVLKFTAIG